MNIQEATPIELTAETITIEMPPAINAYSMAVAAALSRQKRFRVDMQYSMRRADPDRPGREARLET